MSGRPEANFNRDPVDVCVLAFSSDHTAAGDHFDMIDECLARLEGLTAPGRYRLHLGCNNVSPRVMRRIEALCARRGGRIHTGAARRDAQGRNVYPKYPLMGAMYRASRAPWIVWLDDDSMIEADDWLEALEHGINAAPDADQLGKTADVPWIEADEAWLAAAPWYVPGAAPVRRTLPDGTTRIVCDYIVGGFYALSRRAIEMCAIPDPRLFHNGGDMATGLALKCRGLSVAHHTYGVRINAFPRRGMHRDLWQPPGRAAALQRAEIARAAALHVAGDLPML